MLNLKNPHADVLYSLKGKRIYIEITGHSFHGFSDLGLIKAVIQDNTDIEIYGEYDDFSLSRLALKVEYESMLDEDDGEDVFLFRVKYPVTTTDFHFFEYVEDEDE